LSYLNKGVRIILKDVRELDDEGKIYSKTFYSEGGIVEFVEMLDKNGGRSPLIPRVIFVDGKDELSNVMVEVALTYNDSYHEHIYSYVNNINTIEGGTHVSGFRKALTRVFKQYGEKQNLFERAKVEIEGDDFREGLSAIISVRYPSHNLRVKQKPN
jgi:DNA gyrase subunit B